MARSTRKQTELFLLHSPLKPSARLSFQQGRCSAATLLSWIEYQGQSKAVIDEVVRVLGTGPYSCCPAAINHEKLETLVGKYEVRKKAKKRQSEGDKVSDALLQGHLASLFRHRSPCHFFLHDPPQQKDKDFLDDQRGQRKMVMSTVDKESMAKESRKHERLAAERRRKEKELAETLERGEMIELVTGVPPLLNVLIHQLLRPTPTLLLGKRRCLCFSSEKAEITKEVAAAADRVKLTSREPTTSSLPSLQTREC
ncbi:hypothetical protein GWK47_054508 [Chionoecetes opilio]|uniref:Uncharacterized protein n=1 Tax=Chionoecetes opilio TaxID=41210 RepID=A0A8J4XZR1_CHIOP|nr:hypothetical protein GWK47_054508 [Chionoecetes opilio]